jgi:diguanylate cyclase (GGDEF)-like protein/PAS domain S-box-containing protein
MIAAIAVALCVAVAATIVIVRLRARSRDLADKLYRSTLDARDAVERRYTLLEAIPDGVYIIDADETITHVNDEAERLLRAEPGAVVGKTLEQLLDPLASDLLPEIRRARESREILSRTAYFRATGWWIEIRIKPSSSETVIYLRDVTIRKSAEARLFESESRLRMLMEQVPAVLWSVDRLGRFVSLSGAGLTALDIREADLVGRSCNAFLGADDAVQSLVSVFAGTAVQFESLRGERWLRHHVEPLRGTDGAVIGAVGVSIDISEIKKTQHELEAAARRDPLTGLPNRFALEEHLATALKKEGSSAVLFVDLDRFKTINDTLGHRMGDEVLRVVSERLRASIGNGDVIARPGGDEFIVVLDAISSREDVAAVAQRLMRRFAEPIVFEGRELFVSASIGAALSPADGSTAEGIIKNADAAMYRAKAAGRGTCMFYEAGLEGNALDRLVLENDLRDAVRNDQLRLLYQPIVDVATGRLTGAEALLRWTHPTRGEMLPSAFIGLAEETGVIVEITRFVLAKACTFVARMREKTPHFRVAVNLSARDLREPDIVSVIREQLLRSKLEPDALELEVTENVILDEASIAALRALRSLGLRIAVDDFGIAYNSLSYVKRLPITTLKIDRSFVRDVVRDEFDQAIVKAIVTLGTSLGFRVIAEGVESDAQWAFVNALGCDEVQGFRFSHPIEASAMEIMLSAPPDYASLGTPA